jgi:hypothetical protein
MFIVNEPWRLDEGSTPRCRGCQRLAVDDGAAIEPN